MTTRKPNPKERANAKLDTPRQKGYPLIGRFNTETPEEEIRRIYTMTPEEVDDVIRRSGILTPSGKLKRGYR